jgi:hypothetical protein
MNLQSTSPPSPLELALSKLYEITGGSRTSGNVQAARLTTAQRIAYFQSKDFRDWVAYEKSLGHEIFWLKDVDKTQAAGDVFTFFFDWRLANDKFSPQQRQVIADYLRSRKAPVVQFLMRSTLVLPEPLRPEFDSLRPAEVQRLWVRKETGAGPGLGLLDYWSGAYWPSQIGFTREEKLAQVREFAPHYAKRVFPGVADENRLLEEIGVHVVIVSNGDQELAIAAADILGVKPENVVGSHLIYGPDGRATGVNHTYEVFDKEWEERPQPGKALSFHYWLWMNRKRFGWENIDERNIVIAGRDGDSASSDGGMMILMQPAAIGNFMIDTPGEPGRIQKFYKVATKYGWSRGSFFTLVQSPSAQGRLP